MSHAAHCNVNLGDRHPCNCGEDSTVLALAALHTRVTALEAKRAPAEPRDGFGLPYLESSESNAAALADMRRERDNLYKKLATERSNWINREKQLTDELHEMQRMGLVASAEKRVAILETAVDAARKLYISCDCPRQPAEKYQTFLDALAALDTLAAAKCGHCGHGTGSHDEDGKCGFCECKIKR